MIRHLGLCILLTLAITLAGGCGESSKTGPGAAGNPPAPVSSGADPKTGTDMNTTEVASTNTGESSTKDASKTDAEKPKRAEIVFAGGCFWCVEAVFEELEGVISAESGYAGGSKDTANYEDVCTGTTGHAEAVRIVYDPSKISYEKLLAVHFATHDPTTLNRQGNDFGTQYRSAIFYANEDEKKAAASMIARLNESGAFPRKIVTTLEPLKEFYPAEKYHQDYVCNNPLNPYVQHIAMEKVEKVRKKFGQDLKDQSPIKWSPNEK